jgi:RimJ/RimL family protein N-acetyltransferase
MTDWIETPRTRMRPFEDSDTDEAFAWFSDDAVMAHIPGGRDATLEDTRRRIAKYREHQSRFGFSKRLIVHRETGQPIGDAGLFHMPDGHRVELGYRLARPWWGAGYATEVARAWLEWFGEHDKGQTLWADVHPQNVGSQRVLNKLRFVCSHQEPLFEMPMLIFWQSGRISREHANVVPPQMAILPRSLPEPPLTLSSAPVRLLFSKILPGDAIRGFAPSYHFRICVGRVDVGHINLRMGDTEHVIGCAGHVGYEIAPPFRGRHFALSACRALGPFARSLREDLVITCDPENRASHRTIKLLGAVHLDEVPVPSHDPHYSRGSTRKLRFLWRP